MYLNELSISTGGTTELFMVSFVRNCVEEDEAFSYAKFKALIYL